MTLIIAFILMSMINAHWIFYPLVLVVWFFHVIGRVSTK